MAIKQTRYWAIDENADGTVDVAGPGGIVRGDFPLEPGDPAQVFSRSSTFIGNVGEDGGLFDDNGDARVYFLSDSIQLLPGDELPEPEGGELPGGPPTISIAPDNANQNEGDEGTTEYSFTVTREGDLLGASTVEVALVPGDTDADDYGGTLPSPQTVEFAANDTQKTVVFTVSGDTDVELNEAFEVSLEFPTNAVIDPEANSAEGMIVNDDEMGSPPEDGAITGTDGDDIILPEFVSDGVTGGEPSDADDTINALGGDDVVGGGGGADTIDGGGGSDILLGGNGNDIFVFAGDNGTDTITDFEDGFDRIDFTAYAVSSVDDFVIEPQGANTVISGYDGEGNTVTLLNFAAANLGNDDFIFADAPPEPPEPQPSSEPTEGDDVIFGTPEADRIEALEGNDFVFGQGSGDLLIGDREVFVDETAIGGDDFISGGDGDDVIYGDARGDITDPVDPIGGLSAAMRGGNDTLLGDAGTDILIGDAEVVREFAVAGDDLLVAGEGDEGGSGILIGDAKLLTGDAQGGRDVLVGGDSADIIIGDAELIRESARGEEDSLFGGEGDDILYGDALQMEGLSLAGNDRLEGGRGNDILWGDAETLLDLPKRAADGFVFSTGDGLDTIGDFQPDVDKIILANVTAIGDYDDLVANHLTQNQNGHAQIDTDEGLAGNNRITLLGFTVEEFTNGTIDEDDFIFSAITGTTGADTITPEAVSDGVTGGTPSDAADIINALGGNDVVDGAGGADIIDGGGGNDELEGGEGDDRLRGQDGDDEVRGGAGEDKLEGGIGADTLEGGSDNDILEGQDGNDTLDGGEDNDTLAGGAGNDELIGGAGVDTADFSDGEAVTVDLAAGTATGQGSDTLIEIENLTGSRGADFLTGDGSANTILGNPGDDEIDGGGGADVLEGGEGNDILEGQDGNDSLDGGDDADVLDGGGGEDTLLGGEGEDDLRGGPDNDILDGGDNDDKLDGGSGADTLLGGGNEDALVGGSGNDTLDGGGGEDTLQGDAGEDIFRFTGRTSNDDILDFTQGEDKIDLSAYPNVQSKSDLNIKEERGFNGGTEISGYNLDEPRDKIFLQGFDRPLTDDDFIFANGNSIYISDVEIEEGNDGSTTDAVFTVSLSTPVDAQVTVDYATADGTATAGSDYTEVSGTLTFAPGETEQEVRVPITGDGAVEPNESFFVNLSNPVNDVIADGQGQATIVNDDGAPTEGDGVELMGDGADNVLTGGEGDDTLIGGSGDDTLTGAGGDDRLFGGSDDDTVDGGDGDDVLVGGSGDDSLSGGSGDDNLWGGSGNDALIGGSGYDTLRGGSGSDTFVFEAANGNDTITDFTDGSDIIDLSAYDVSDIDDFDIGREGDDTVISDYDGIGNTITLENFDPDDLSNDDFAFA